jgi:hypothetical protein
VIASSCLANYRPPYESLLSVLGTAFRELANAPVTSAWITTHYSSLLSSLLSHLSVSSDPELVSSFFEIHSKLLESHQLQILTPEVLSQLVSTSCAALRGVTNRNPSNSVLYYVILLYSLDSLREQLRAYVQDLAFSLLLGLEKLHITTFHHVASLICILRAYQTEFQQGAIAALTSEAYAGLKENQKNMVLRCLLGLPSKPISNLKQLAQDLSKILRGLATPDILMASEIALGGALKKQQA